MDKIFGWAVKALGVFIAIVVVLVVFRVAWNFVFYGSASVPATISDTSEDRGKGTDRQRATAPRRNAVKEKYLSDCAANGAPVTQLGGGRMNCYREPRVTTYVD